SQRSGEPTRRSTETSTNVGAIASHQWVCDAIYCGFPTRKDFVSHDLLILAARARARRHADGSRGSNANLTDLFARSDVSYHAVHRIALVGHASQAAADDSFSFLDDNRGDNNIGDSRCINVPLWGILLFAADVVSGFRDDDATGKNLRLAVFNDDNVFKPVRNTDNFAMPNSHSAIGERF